MLGAVGALEVGGMMEMVPVEGMPAFWTVLSTVEDVDAAVAAAQAIGGTVLQPAFDLPDARIAAIADPTGAMFGLLNGLRADGNHLSHRDRRSAPSVPIRVATVAAWTR